VTLERARERAAVLDRKMEQEISARVLGSPHEVFSQIRAYLILRAGEMENKNNPIQLLRFRPEQNGVAAILLGPQIDKGPDPAHFHFDSGARLSFGLTLRELSRRQSRLVSFRYHYHLSDQPPASRSPAYFRFDLNEAPHDDPLSEPRCHLHPGLEDVRIPMSLHDPFEILDRVFFVLEKFA
jgi:hypothetical protein